MNTYLAQGFTPKEMRVSCAHKYRLCDCGAVHCIGACKFTQSSAGEYKVLMEDGSYQTFLVEPAPVKRAPCGFHGGEMI